MKYSGERREPARCEGSRKVARFPYNQDYIRNEKRDVSDIPVFKMKPEMIT